MYEQEERWKRGGLYLEGGAGLLWDGGRGTRDVADHFHGTPLSSPASVVWTASNTARSAERHGGMAAANGGGAAAAAAAVAAR